MKFFLPIIFFILANTYSYSLSAEESLTVKQQLDRIMQEISDLNKAVFNKSFSHEEDVREYLNKIRINKKNIVNAEDWLYDKIGEKLTIIPDSIFYLLPFETLIDENDNYLVENYNIYYANNLQSFNNIKQSNTANNNSLIAFGGAEYNKKNQSIKSININQIFNKTDLAQINNDVQKNINNNSTIRGDYKKLGIQNWQNLPGTLEEINKISLHMTNSKIISGKNVSEKTIKHLSESGDLSKFNIIPKTPTKIAVSAKLNEYGFSKPQQEILIKSATAPYNNLSKTFPSAPPIISPPNIWWTILVSFLIHTKK